MNIEQFKEAINSNEIDTPEGLDGVTLIEDGEWISDGKYDYRNDVYKAYENYFKVRSSRSGSYCLGYYYNDPHVTQVVPREVVQTITIWDNV